jgi:hypothetical protein
MKPIKFLFCWLTVIENLTKIENRDLEKRTQKTENTLIYDWTFLFQNEQKTSKSVYMTFLVA